MALGAEDSEQDAASARPRTVSAAGALGRFMVANLAQRMPRGSTPPPHPAGIGLLPACGPLALSRHRPGPPGTRDQGAASELLARSPGGLVAGQERWSLRPHGPRRALRPRLRWLLLGRPPDALEARRHLVSAGPEHLLRPESPGCLKAQSGEQEERVDPEGHGRSMAGTCGAGLQRYPRASPCLPSRMAKGSPAAPQAQRPSPEVSTPAAWGSASSDSPARAWSTDPSVSRCIIFFTSGESPIITPPAMTAVQPIVV